MPEPKTDYLAHWERNIFAPISSSFCLDSFLSGEKSKLSCTETIWPRKKVYIFWKVMGLTLAKER